MTVKFDEFYGLAIDGNPYIIHKHINEELRKETKYPIYEGDTGADVVEEIVRRGGEFYDGKTAQKLTPFKLKYTDVYMSRFKYLPKEKRPNNPDFAEYSWIVLDPGQYIYGKYLTDLIKNGVLTTDDIINKRPGRKKVAT